MNEEEQQKTGVRRVNNYPLYIVIGLAAVFCFIVAKVSYKRGEMQKMAMEKKEDKNNTQDSKMMAENVLNPRKPIIPPEISKPEIAKPVEKPEPPKVDPEQERIKQAKSQMFSQAVAAKTSLDMSGNPQVVKEAKPTINDISNLVSDTEKKDWKLKNHVEAPYSSYLLRAGSVVPGVMLSGINSELPGKIIGQVSQDVYDTATGRELLLPQGSKLFGDYSSEIIFGQEAVAVSWNRITFPDGKVLDLGDMPGADLAGYSGYRDQVNNHYMKTFGSALLMSAILAGTALTQTQGTSSGLGYQQNSTTTMSQVLGQQMGQASLQVLRKNLNVAPTLEIRPGYEFNVIVTKDVDFRSVYEPFDYE